MAHLALSRDGRFVAFSSMASNLVEGDTHVCRIPSRFMTRYNCRDVFVHDRQTRQTTRVSVATGGAQSDNDSRGAHLSDDGRFVSFLSSASTLVAGDTNAAADVFLHDRQTGVTERLTVGRDGREASRGVDNVPPTMSGDTRFVAFVSRSPELNRSRH